MMWIRTPRGLRLNLAALAYVEPYESAVHGGQSVRAYFLAGGSRTDGNFGAVVALAEYLFHGEDAAALLASIDMLAEGRA